MTQHIESVLLNDAILNKVEAYLGNSTEVIEVVGKNVSPTREYIKTFVTICASLGSDAAVPAFKADLQRVLDGSIRSAQKGIAGTFFGNKESAYVEGESAKGRRRDEKINSYSSAIIDGQNFSTDRNLLAMSAVCFSLSNVQAHDYQKTVDHTKAQQNIQSWCSDHSKAGRFANSLFNSHMKEQAGWHKLAAQPAVTARVIQMALTFPPYMAALPELFKINQLLGGVLLYGLGLLSRGEADTVKKAWHANPVVHLGLRLINFQEHFLPPLYNHYINEQPFLTEVKNAVNKTHSWESTEENASVAVTIFGPIFNIYKHKFKNYEYGIAVANWLQNTKEYGLRTTKNPHSHEKQQQNDGGGCFIAGTKVLLSNGTSIAIEQVKEGQEVLTRDAGVGVVSSERVVTVHKSGDLYGINDDEPFFTGSHVFYTPTGHRALHPSSAQEENPWLEVNQLREGDHVYCADHVSTDASGKQTINYNLVLVKKFTHAVLPNVPVYGLHYHEGLRSYHANGYLVHLNYPEITGNFLAGGLNNLSATEQDKLRTNLLKTMPELRKAFGASIADAIEGVVEQKAEVVKNAQHPHKSKLQPGIGQLHYRKYYFAHAEQQGALPKQLIVCKQHLFIDGAPVKRAKFQKKELHWTRKTTTGKYEHGWVGFEGPHLLNGSGHLLVTNNKQELVRESNDVHKPLSFHLVTTSPTVEAHPAVRSTGLAATPTLVHPQTMSERDLQAAVKADAFKYSTFISKTPMQEDALPLDPDSDDTPDGYAAFWDFLYGSALENGDTFAFLYFKVGEQLRHFGKQYGFTGSSNLRVFIQVDVNIRPFVNYSQFEIIFSSDSQNFTGIAWAYDPDAKGYLGAKYTMYGSYASEESVLVENEVHNLVVRKAYNLQSLADGADVLSSPPAGRYATTEVEKPAPAPVTTFLATADKLSARKLQLLAVSGDLPTNSQVKDSSFKQLHEMMLATVPEDWLTNVFGESRPTLDSEALRLQAQQQDVKNFLINKFGVGYAAKALATIPEASGDATPEDWRKLDYYFLGKDTDNVLSKDPVFNKLNKLLALNTYLTYAPDLNKYIADAKGTNKWAQQLYDRIISPVFLNSLRVGMDSGAAADTYIKLNHIIMVLRLIGTPDSKLPVQFYDKVMNFLAHNTSKFDETTLDAAVMSDYLYQMIVIIFTNESDDFSPAVKAKYREDITKMAKELQIEVTADARAFASSVVTHSNAIVTEMCSLFILRFDGAGKKLGTWAARASNMVDGLNAKFPKFTATTNAISKLGTLGFYAFSLYSTAQALRGWKDLNPSQKTQLIVNSINMTAQIILKSGPEFLDSLISAWRVLRNPQNATPKEVEMAGAIVDELAEIEAREMSAEVEDMSGQLGNKAEVATEGSYQEATSQEESIFARFANSKASRLTLKGLNIVALGVSAWALGEQISSDFNNGASVTQKALDITSLIITGVQGVLEAIDLVLLILDIACPAFAIVGAVLAIAGLVLQLVGLFTNKPPSKKPPPSAQQQFFKAHVLPFFSSLSLPPKEFYSDDFAPQLNRFYQIVHTKVKNNKPSSEYLQLSALTGDVHLTTSKAFKTADDRSKQLWRFVAGTAAQEKEVPFTLYSLADPYTLASDSKVATKPSATYFLRNGGNKEYYLVDVVNGKALTYGKDGAISFEPYNYDNTNQRWSFNMRQDAGIPIANRAYYFASKYKTGEVMGADSNNVKLIADEHPSTTQAHEWSFVYKSSGDAFSYYQVINKQTKTVLAYTKMNDGEPLALVHPNDKDSKQLWAIAPAYSGVYFVPFDNNTKAIKCISASDRLVIGPLDFGTNNEVWDLVLINEPLK